MRRAVTFFCAMLLLHGCAPEPSNGREMIAQFYRSYLPAVKGHPPMSNSLKVLIAENAKLCEQYRPNEICGFEAYAIPYLDAQDYDDGMTFENTHTTVTEAADGTIKVRLNIFPSDPAHAERNTREIRYRVIPENGRWVVDDIIFDTTLTARQGLEFDNDGIRDEAARKAKAR